MIIQLTTADYATEPDDYTDDLSVMEHDYTWGENPPLTETVYLIEVDNIDTLLSDLTHENFVLGKPTGGSDYDDAEWIVTVYDYYIE